MTRAEEDLILLGNQLEHLAIDLTGAGAPNVHLLLRRAVSDVRAAQALLTSWNRYRGARETPPFTAVAGVEGGSGDVNCG